MLKPTIEEQRYSEFLDVLTDTISGTDMMSEAWHQEMYRFWCATMDRARDWRHIDTVPIDTEALLLGTHGYAMGYKSFYGWEPSGVSTSYDMAVPTFDIGQITHCIPLINSWDQRVLLKTREQQDAIAN